MKNMTQAPMSSYKLRSRRLILKLMTAYKSNQYRFKQIFDEFGAYLCSVLGFLLIVALAYLFRLIKFNLRKRMCNFKPLGTGLILKEIKLFYFYFYFLKHTKRVYMSVKRFKV
jgi:hypothetical protein